MKKFLLLACVAAVAVWLAAQNAATPKPLADVMPAGAMLYLEARNFSSLVNDWNSSSEKKAWLASDNYQVFSRSRLYLRLKQVFEEYSNATGVPPDMNLLTSVAGRESAIAIYDISTLEFLYVTRLPSTQAMQSVLWRAKERFAARTAAGTPYYTKTDPATRRTASFAIVGDLLLAATHEEALTGALGLLSGAPGNTVRREPWFEEASRAAAAPGELRMVMNMEKLTRNPSFRSYWIQRNVSNLRQYSSAIDDLRRSTSEVREDRVLLRTDPAPVPDTSALPALLRLAANASLYRAWAQPDPAFVLDLISAKILRPGPRSAAESRIAPVVSLDAPLAGDEADLETRIDGAPYEAPGAVYRPEPLQALLSANHPRAVLQLQSSRTTPDRVFVTNDSTIVIEGSSNWNAAAVRDAITRAIESLYTTSRIGVEWRERRAGRVALWEIDGLAPVALATRGATLLISNQSGNLEALLPLLDGAVPAVTASYAAGYRAAAEIPNYTRIMRHIEAPQAGAQAPGEPPLFSANLAGLARTLQRVQSVSVFANDGGRNVKQTIRYTLGR
jgi:hypothetical protein